MTYRIILRPAAAGHAVEVVHPDGRIEQVSARDAWLRFDFRTA